MYSYYNIPDPIALCGWVVTILSCNFIVGVTRNCNIIDQIYIDLSFRGSSIE